jgi:predicted N-acetyltransferase YhbS
MKIRLLKPVDIKATAALIGRNYSKKYEYSAALELKDMFGASAIKPTYFVAVEDKKIIGLGGFMQSGMDYYLYEIFWVNVAPERQRQGIGKKIVERIIAEIKKKKGARAIILTADTLRGDQKYYKDNFKFKTIAKFDKNSEHIMFLSLE